MTATIKKTFFVMIVFGFILLCGCTGGLYNKEISRENTLQTRDLKIKDSPEKIDIASAGAAEKIVQSYASDDRYLAEAGKKVTADNSHKKNIPKPLGKAVPILEYHAVDDKITGWDELYVSPGEFQKQMDFLKKNNYNVITIDQLPNIKKISKPVIITFDDGYENNFTYAYPVLKKYNFKATVFLIAGAVDSPFFLTRTQVQQMKDIFSFQSHTFSHPHLSKLKPDEMENELVQSQKKIEELTSAKVYALAYPYGDYTRRVMEITKKHYKYGFYSLGGPYHEGDDLYKIKRVYITRKLDIKGFAERINGI